MGRGDRRLGAVIEDVWRHGGTFQEWSEHFSYDLWLEACERCGIDLEWYVYRHRSDDEVFPWDHLSAGLHKDFLWQDWRDALNEVGLPDCRWTPCYDCGACTGYGLEHVVASATARRRQPGTGQDLSLAPPRAAPSRSAGPLDGRARRTERQGPRGPGSHPLPSSALRFTSHRDVADLERGLRRAILAHRGPRPGPSSARLALPPVTSPRQLDVARRPGACAVGQRLLDRPCGDAAVGLPRERIAPAGRDQLHLAHRGR
jgi:hypothetical protein